MIKASVGTSSTTACAEIAPVSADSTSTVPNGLRRLMKVVTAASVVAAQPAIAGAHDQHSAPSIVVADTTARSPMFRYRSETVVAHNQEVSETAMAIAAVGDISLLPQLRAVADMLMASQTAMTEIAGLETGSGQSGINHGDSQASAAAEAVLLALPKDPSDDDFDAVEAALTQLISVFQVSAVNAMHDLLIGGRIDDHIAAGIIEALGRIEHKPTLPSRRWLLSRCLGFDLPLLRDAAARGAAYLDDPRLIPALRRGLERETHHLVREMLQQAIQQLEATVPKCAVS